VSENISEQLKNLVKTTIETVVVEMLDILVAEGVKKQIVLATVGKELVMYGSTAIGAAASLGSEISTQLGRNCLSSFQEKIRDMQKSLQELN